MFSCRTVANLRVNRLTNEVCRRSSQFVPKHEPVSEKEISKLETFLGSKSNILVLTGAGVSTESGKASLL